MAPSPQRKHTCNFTTNVTVQPAVKPSKSTPFMNGDYKTNRVEVAKKQAQIMNIIKN